MNFKKVFLVNPKLKVIQLDQGKAGDNKKEMVYKKKALFLIN